MWRTGVPALLATSAWVITLTILLTLWIDDNQSKYDAKNPDILFISNVGAQYKLPFVIGASITAFFFSLTMFMYIFVHKAHFEAHQNNQGEEGPLVRGYHILFDTLAALFALLASVSLIGLAVFDSRDHSNIHWILTLCFIAFLTVCAIFNTIGIRWLNKRGISNLLVSKIVKILVIILALLLAIVMIVLMSICRGEETTDTCISRRSVAAVFEWIIAGLFAVFLASCIGEATGVHR